MAGGFAKDGAVQEQIDATIEDAVKRARDQIPLGDSLTNCEECDKIIPPARRPVFHRLVVCLTCKRFAMSDLGKTKK